MKVSSVAAPIRLAMMISSSRSRLRNSMKVPAAIERSVWPSDHSTVARPTRPRNVSVLRSTHDRSNPSAPPTPPLILRSLRKQASRRVRPKTHSQDPEPGLMVRDGAKAPPHHEDYQLGPIS